MLVKQAAWALKVLVRSTESYLADQSYVIDHADGVDRGVGRGGGDAVRARDRGGSHLHGGRRFFGREEDGIYKVDIGIIVGATFGEEKQSWTAGPFESREAASGARVAGRSVDESNAEWTGKVERKSRARRERSVCGLLWILVDSRVSSMVVEK